MQSHKYFYIHQFFSFENILNCFLVHENMKKFSLKVAHNS